MKRIIPFGLITLGFLLSFGVLGQLYWNNRESSPAAVNLPDQLAGLSMTASKSGDEAIAEFTDLHGKEFPITSGSVGIYGNREITVWVAGAPSASIALEMTDAMQAKIAKGNSPFSPLNEINNGSRKIYALEGMGQRHFYFQSGNFVIWLAADPALADQALQQILEVYS